MVRLPRNLSRVAIACSLALPLTSMSTWAQDNPAAPAAPAVEAPAATPEAPAPPPPAEAAPAAPAPATAAQPAPAEAPTDLKRAVANYWHYGKIGRYDLQAAEGEKIVAAGTDPVAVLDAFNAHIDSTEVNGRKDNLEEWLYRFQGVEKVRDTTTKIIAILNQGRETFRKDPAFIDQQIQRLNKGELAYRNAMVQLRKSGEHAVPIMVDYLRNPAKRDFHGAIRRGLRDLGKSALSPLVAATEMTGADSTEALVAVVTALGDIAYDDVIPYLTRIANDPNAAGAVRQAAVQAIARAGGGAAGALNASNLFYELGEKFYYGNASITPDVRDQSTPANVWFWSDDKGLTYKPVPQEIFNEVMALRAAEYALKLGSSQDALSLWLAANYKREAELPQGAADPTRAENQPPAHYYGVSAGPQYLNAALTRALRDRNSAVALRVIKSLQDIVGRHNLFAGNQAGPLVDAMGSGDRLVRFEAAFALAAALPQQSFQGQDRVVPLLAEALSQTGTPTVLVVAPTQDQANALVDGLKAAGYTAAGAGSADAAVSSAVQLPAVDVILISEDIGPANVDKLFVVASQNPRLQGASRIVITKTAGSPYATRAINDRMLSVTQVAEPAALKPVIDGARAKGASLALDAEMANSYATRAGQLLSNLAISNDNVLDLTAAEQTLLGAMNDARPDIIKSAGSVLARVNLKAAQPALLIAASAEKPDDVKISLYKSLAHNASTFGPQLEAAQVQTLEGTVVEAQNLDVRAAAAEARGALNLPAEEAKTLIINQSTGTGGAAAPTTKPAGEAAAAVSR